MNEIFHLRPDILFTSEEFLTVLFLSSCPFLRAFTFARQGKCLNQISLIGGCVSEK